MSLPLVLALALPARAATDEVVDEVAVALLETTAAMSAELGHVA